MRSLNHPALDDVSLTQVLYALSDPERLRVVHELAGCGEASSCTTRRRSGSLRA